MESEVVVCYGSDILFIAPDNYPTSEYYANTENTKGDSSEPSVHVAEERSNLLPTWTARKKYSTGMIYSVR